MTPFISNQTIFIHVINRPLSLLQLPSFIYISVLVRLRMALVWAENTVAKLCR